MNRWILVSLKNCSGKKTMLKNKTFSQKYNKYNLRCMDQKPYNNYFFRQVIFNTVFVSGLCIFGPFAWGRNWRHQYNPLVAPKKYEVGILPEFHFVLAELVVCVLVEELKFYYSHRVLHHKTVSIISPSLYM